MAQVDAYQIQYRQEWIRGFEQMQSLVRDAVTTEAVIKGNQARFLVADSGGASTVNRAVNGNIPARVDDLTTATATLTEEHDLVKKTRFNIFASQADQRQIMQWTSMGVINRKIDNQIITALDGVTPSTILASGKITLARAMDALTALGEAEVAYDGDIWGFITPAALGQLMQITSFTSADYITKKPLDTAAKQPKMQGYYEWGNIKWIVHPNLTGVGTASANCYVFHRSAIGHAADTGGMNSAVGYNDEQDYSYCRSTMFMGAVVLQLAGVVRIINDDTV